jgi:predicted small integral membrane protein
MLEWMYWTTENAIIVGMVYLIVIIMVIADYKRGSARRKGFLPYQTARGDRTFLCFMFTMAIGFLWLAFIRPYITMWGALAVALVVDAIIFTKA